MPERHSSRVLLIEDEEGLRGLYARFLREQGYEVLEARDGREGLSVYARTPCEIVVTDILMPNKEGLETIRELRRQASSSKIVAITGGLQYAEVDLLDVAKKLGADHALHKPFPLTALLDAIRT